MDANLSKDFTKQDLERMMLKLFPEYRFKWLKLLNMKVIAGKFKGCRNNRAILKKNITNEILLFYFESEDGKKGLRWQIQMNQTFSMAFIFILGVLPGLVFYLVIYLTVMRRRQKKINKLILSEIDRLNNQH